MLTAVIRTIITLITERLDMNLKTIEEINMFVRQYFMNETKNKNMSMGSRLLIHLQAFKYVERHKHNKYNSFGQAWLMSFILTNSPLILAKLDII